MVEILFGGTVGQNLQDIGVGISWTEVMQTSSGTVVLALSGQGGGLVSLGFDGTGRAYVADTQYFSMGLWAAATGGVALITTTTDIIATVASEGSSSLVGYALQGDQIGALTVVSGTGLSAGAGTLYQQSGGFLFSANANGDLRCFRADGAGSFLAGSITPDTGSSFHAVPGALAQIQVQGRSYLLTSCLQDVGVSAYEVNQATGGLRHTDSIDSANGLGMFSSPIAMETAVLAGRGYIVVASAADTGTGAALSVLQIAADGKMQVTDHILDSQATRFGRVTALEVVEHKGWVYVIAQGGEQGVSLFTLMPGGQLLHLNSFVGTAEINLASQSSLAAAVINDQLQLLISTHATTGFTQLSVDLSDQREIQQAGPNGTTLNGTSGRDMLMGGIGRDTLNGGNGDDIISDGGGEDRMAGGSGADVFVLAADGARDVIVDFDATQDKIDLSFIPMLYSADQVSFVSMAWGGVLSYRGENLELRSASGRPLDAAQVLSSLVWGADRPPLVLRQEQQGSSGNDTLMGVDGGDIIHAGAGHDIITSLAGDDEIYGENGDDTVYAGAHNDTVFGGEGDDLIYLGEGEDQAFGGDGFDTIHGLDGNDTVTGGNGRDLIYLNQGNDIFNDNTQGGDLGRDTVFAGLGNDTIQGGNGDDAFFGQWGNDLIFGRLGNDLVYGGAQFDTIYGGDGNDTIDGGDGRDLVYLNFGNDTYYDNAQGGYLGQDTVYAGYGSDTIQGGNGDDAFFGQWGNDLIFGRLGNDLVYGGDQFDTIYGGEGNDTVDGGNGRDLIFLNQGNDLYHDNTQGGVSGRDTVYAGLGNDTIQGGNGDDVFHGQWGNDVIFARFGNDTVYAGDQFDFIDAGDGNDLVFGGKGGDRVYLGNGNDVYVDTAQTGAFGQDTITGGAGVDRFEFQAVMSADVITDFQVGVDELRLTQSLWGGGLGAAQVVSTYASVTAGGVLFDFGAGQSILLEGLNSMAGLDSDILLG